jgi:hypothetical protein
MKIVITKRGDDYHACLEGHPEIWGCGKTQNEAIGDLISSHKDTLKIEVEYK